MNLQGNARNHNNKPKLENDDNMFVNFQQSADYEGNTEGKSETETDLQDVVLGNEKERGRWLKEAENRKNSSAYADLDDYIYYSRKRKSSHSHHKHHSHHRKHHRKKGLKRWQKISIGIISTIIGLIVAAVAAMVVLVYMGESSLLNNDNLSIAVPDDATGSDNGMYITYKGVKYKYNENITSILCMGVDRETLGNVDGDIGTGGAADSLFLISLDASNGETNIINISRDTMTDIGIYSVDGKYIESREAQICLAYAYGDGKETSCHNEIVAVRQLFYNLPINSYLALNLEGIAPINDTVGGVTVTSPETIGDFKEGETYTLKGDLAESFVRSRSHATVEGNNLRMQRQKIYLESFASSLIQLTMSDISAPVNIFNAATPYICTDINPSKIAFLSVNAIRGNYNGFEIKSIPGSVKKGDEYAEFYVNEDEFFKLFLDVYYDPVNETE